MKKVIKTALTGLMVVALNSAAYAGDGINGFISNGSELNGMSQQGLEKKLDDYLRELPMDIPFSGVATSKPQPTDRRELASTGFINSEQGRETLKYLIECAMPETVELYATHDGVEYKFRGGMNLAPNWLDEKPTESEERWVSACMLARTNYFRKKVMISMQTRTEPTPEYLKPTPEEAAATIYEGDFFGNIFAPQPVAYACIGNRTPEQNRDDILKARICTEVDAGITGYQFPMTYCRFLITGDCDQPGSHTVNGMEYKENISVHLRPLGPRIKSESN